jgi:hypothetical protein
MALGTDNPQVFTPNELNPLHTPMHLDLHVGGSTPLRNLYGPCDAYSLQTQIGVGLPAPPKQSYIGGDRYNLYTSRPQYH